MTTKEQIKELTEALRKAHDWAYRFVGPRAYVKDFEELEAVCAVLKKYELPKRLRMQWILSVKSESGDDYGPWAFSEKPTDDEIEKWLREECPGEWEALDDGTYDGPGFRGSYCHIELDEVAPPQRKRKRNRKLDGSRP